MAKVDAWFDDAMPPLVRSHLLLFFMKYMNLLILQGHFIQVEYNIYFVLSFEPLMNELINTHLGSSFR